MLNGMKPPSSKKVLLGAFIVGVFVVVLVLHGAKKHEASPEQETRETRVSPLSEFYDDHPKPLRKLNGYRYTGYSETASSSSKPCKLPENAMESVKTFVLFTGYPRSGHSILGSMMNAHPHMAIAYNYIAISKQWDIYEQETRHAEAKSKLFNGVFSHSCRDQNFKHENSSKKGYTLSIDYPWWGSYKDPLQVIGDRSAGLMTDLYQKNETWFKMSFERLRRTVNIPVKVIHVVRNPFDLISTASIYSAGKRESKQHPDEFNTALDFVLNLKLKASNSSKQTKYKNDTQLQAKIQSVFKMADAVTSMIDLYGQENVLDVHNSDLVMQPKRTLRRICKFLNLRCPPDYVDVCAEKTFKSLSKTRDVVEWPKRLRERVEKKLSKYPFFQRYSFENDYSKGD